MLADRSARRTSFDVRRHLFSWLSLMLFLISAAAQADSNTAIGSWRLDETPTSCAISNSYPIKDGRFLYAGMSSTGNYFIRLHEPSFPWTKVAIYPIVLKLADKDFPFEIKRTDTVDGTPGFVVSGNQVLFDSLAAASSLQVIFESKTIAAVDLSGVAEAAEKFRECATRVAAAAPALELIVLKKPVPIAASWPSENNRPKEALIAKSITGRVGFRLNVEKNGKTVGCTILESSGSHELDQFTCELLKSKARFKLARNRDGAPVPGDYTTSISWR